MTVSAVKDVAAAPANDPASAPHREFVWNRAAEPCRVWWAGSSFHATAAHSTAARQAGSVAKRNDSAVKLTNDGQPQNDPAVKPTRVDFVAVHFALVTEIVIVIALATAHDRCAMPRPLRTHAVCHDSLPRRDHSNGCGPRSMPRPGPMIGRLIDHLSLLQHSRRSTDHRSRSRRRSAAPSVRIGVTPARMYSAAANVDRIRVSSRSCRSPDWPRMYPWQPFDPLRATCPPARFLIVTEFGGSTACPTK